MSGVISKNLFAVLEVSEPQTSQQKPKKTASRPAAPAQAVKAEDQTFG